MKKNETIILKLNGGLGNQMFQWAFARMLQFTTEVEVLLDMSFFENNYSRPFQLDIFSLEPKFVEDFATKLKLKIIWFLRKRLYDRKFLGYNVFREKKFNFDPSIHTIKPNTFIEGFFQSEKYFKMIESTIRDDFRFTAIPDQENSRIIGKIESGPSISIHIRRGDYVQKKRYQDVYAACSIDYYKRAVKHIMAKHPQVTAFIFSDDIPWAKSNLRLPCECVFVSHNQNENSYEDMRLMSRCSHNVIANSSFSWWGAWLNNNPNKIVVAPKKWFNDDKIIQSDIIPESWVRLDN